MKITLKNGKSFQINKRDLPVLDGWNVSVNFRNVLCQKYDSDGLLVAKTLHKLIMKTPKGMVVDHINGDVTDNRRRNLRVCSHLENSRNSKKQKNNTSGYKGVTRRSGYKKPFWARIKYKGKQISLGQFTTAKEAGIAYNDAARKYFMEFARLNKIAGV